MKQKLMGIFPLLMLSFSSYAIEQQFSVVKSDIGTINFQFEQIKDQNFIKQAIPISFPAASGSETVLTQYDDMRKTLLVIEMSDVIASALSSFNTCKKKSAKRERLVISLLESANSIEEKLVSLGKKQQLESNFFSAIKLINELAKNISDYQEPSNFGCYRTPKGLTGMHMECAFAPVAASYMSITTGGAKDIGHFKMKIEQGLVPEPSDFPIEGFMNEFTLAVPGLGSNDYLALHPTTAFDTTTKKLYVQLGMSTSITPQTFKRKPLNLSFVVDISGSMQDEDGTQKSRLEWAKWVMDLAIEKMGPEDRISIVAFDDKVKIVLAPTALENKDEIKKTYADLEPRGGTDVYIGLHQGFELVAQNKNSQFENRVILLSDAGNNTGYGTTETLLALITDNASQQDPIGFTAIGVGLNFEEKLIHRISMSKGGNYLFVQTGEKLVSFFEEFDYLVSPVAYNFKASVMLNRDVKAELVRAYGIPMRDGEPLENIINVRTLFFAGKGSGAMVFVYQL